MFRDARQARAVPVETIVCRRSACAASLVLTIDDDLSVRYEPVDALSHAEVVHGPQGLRKTEYVQAWFDQEHSLEVTARKNIGSMMKFKRGSFRPGKQGRTNMHPCLRCSK